MNDILQMGSSSCDLDDTLWRHNEVVYSKYELEFFLTTSSYETGRLFIWHLLFCKLQTVSVKFKFSNKYSGSYESKKISYRSGNAIIINKRKLS